MKAFLIICSFFFQINQLFAQIDSSSQTEKLMQQAINNYDGNRFTQSLELLNQAILLNNQKTLIDILYYYKSLVLYNLSAKTEAIETLNLAITNLSQPKPHYLTLRGKIYFELSNYERASNDFKLSLTQNKNQTEALTLLAALQLQNKETMPALQNLNLALQIDKNYAMAYFYRGFVWFELLEPAKACNDWQQAELLHFETVRNYKSQFCK